MKNDNLSPTAIDFSKASNYFWHRSPWLRRVAWGIGVWLVFCALAYAGVPALLKWQLAKIGTEKLGRALTIGAVDFKPWSLELTLHDLALAKAGPAAAENPQATSQLPQLKIKRLYIDAELSSLLQLAPVVDAIEVDEPVVSLTHLGDGRYDMDDILARFQTADTAPASKTPHFALYNLRLNDGRVELADAFHQSNHVLSDLQLAVPFLSNLPSKRDIKIAPRLAFNLNGSRFDTAAVGTPFAQTHQADATVVLRDFDLKPYLSYWPSNLPFRPQGALLQADVKVAFEQTGAPVVRISGTVTANKVRLLKANSPMAAVGGNAEVLAFERLHILMDDVRPLERLVKLTSVALSAPELSLTRDKAGRLNLMPTAQVATKNIAVGADQQSANVQIDINAKSDVATPWKVQVGTLNISGGQLKWLDQTLPSPAQVRLVGLSVNAAAIAYPFTAAAPLRFEGSVGLDAAGLAGAALAKPAHIDFKGTATDQAADMTATVAGWPLSMAAPYVGQFLLPTLDGRLDTQLGVNWQAAAGQPQRLRITTPAIAVSGMQLAQGGKALASLQRAELTQVEVDVPGQTFRAAKMQINQPRARVERDAKNNWMHERWLVSRGKAAPDPSPQAVPAWKVAIDEVLLSGGAVSFSDKAGARPVAFEVTALNAQLGGLLLDDSPPGKRQAAKPVPLSASLRLASGSFPPGKFDFKGSAGAAPLQLNGQLSAERLPLQAFEPYFGDNINIELLRADTSFKGRVAYLQTAAGPQVQWLGDAALESFRANSVAPAEDLLAWKALNLEGLSVVISPGKATRVDVRQTVLSDFFARVIVLPIGRINLQDLLKPPAAAAALAGPAEVKNDPKTIAPNADVTSENRVKTLQNPLGAGSAAAAPAQLAPDGLEAIINVGPISLTNGKVAFSDRFVKPNYSADLSELTGKLSAFSSLALGTDAASSMADLELRGKAEGTASLEILGKLNPLAKPLALDITGKVRDLDLPPLSPYAIKYAGYGIQRGKLSVDVNYVVQPNGQLTAKNKLVLNQLSFGDKVEGAAASLPVKLAVALLADRNGVIDLDLPISGSLNDPQFSLGPVIVKVILNVIVKAVTAPFSLLSHALGGGSGDELGRVGFAPGSTQLTTEARAALDKVAKALSDRPALVLTVVGVSSLEAERGGYQREQLAAQVRAEKRRQLARQGQGEDDATAAQTPVSPEEYPALLKAVYGRADFAKPRNLIGLRKDLPVAEMENLLLAAISASPQALQELAAKRGLAVKDYLVSRDLPSSRLFVGATKMVPADAKWSPHAELNLAMP